MAGSRSTVRPGAFVTPARAVRLPRTRRYILCRRRQALMTARMCVLLLRAGGAQAERPHVGPHLFDVGQALLFGAAHARVAPAQGILPRSRPDGVLLLVIDHDLIDRRIFLLVRVHRLSLSPFPRRRPDQAA